MMGGFSWPVTIILFGDIVDIFVEYENSRNNNITNNSSITLEEFMNKTYFLSGGSFIRGVMYFTCFFLIISCFSRAATNQIHTIRVKYFNSVLNQEISWFDVRPSGDCSSRITALFKVLFVILSNDEIIL
jgi:ABC-type multidrug transport system fused ATPase/permease subunit